MGRLIHKGDKISLTHYTGRVEGTLLEVLPWSLLDGEGNLTGGVVHDLSRIRVRLNNPSSAYTSEQTYLLGEFKEARNRGLLAVDMPGNYFLLLNKSRRRAA